jgi:hypothetical protein
VCVCVCVCVVCVCVLCVCVCCVCVCVCVCVTVAKALMPKVAIRTRTRTRVCHSALEDTKRTPNMKGVISALFADDALGWPVPQARAGHSFAIVRVTVRRPSSRYDRTHAGDETHV